MSRPILITALVMGFILPVGQELGVAAPVIFTGDVPSDFAAAGEFFLDPEGALEDVGMPPCISSTGNAIIQLAIAYDTLNDTLYVGIDTVGIALDVDGDGDPGHTSDALAGLGGTDYPSVGGAESFTFSIDFDCDSFFDVIAGLDLASTATEGYQVAYFNYGPGDPSMPYFAFGNSIPGVGGSMNHDPSVNMPDLEFTITGLRNIDPDFNGENIRMHVFVGSLADDGIGEDFMQVFCIPEPATIILMGGVVAFLAGTLRKRLTSHVS